MTRKYLCALAAAAMLVFSSANALETSVAPKVTKLGLDAPKTGLYVGNSFTYYNCGMGSYLRAMTGKDKWIGRMITISAGALSFHDVEAYLAKRDLDPYDKNDPKFDVVFLQGQSNEPIHPKRKANFEKYLKKHVETIRAHGSVPVVVDTWALQDKPEQTRQLADAIITQANASNAMVAPVGLAFAESLKLRPDLILHAPDKRHPSSAGSLLYASVLYAVLFHESPEGRTVSTVCEKPLKDEDVRHLQRVAWQTVKEFFGW